MSYVHLFVIKDDRIYLTNMHYRSAMRLLERHMDKMLPSINHRFLDAGYIVLDLNKQVLINNQSAFPVRGILGKKELYVIDA